MNPRIRIILILLLLSISCFANLKEDKNLIRASYIGDIAKIELALENGANIDVKYGKSKQTPLLIAIFNGNIKTAKFLLQKGADINASSNAKRGVVNYSLYLDDFDFFKYLLRKNAPLDHEDRDGDIFTYASTNLDIRYANELLKYKKFAINKRFNPNYENKKYYWYDTTALLKACEYNDIKMVKFLLLLGADVNITTSKGETPLLIALKYEYKKLLKYLVKHGAKLDVEDDAKNSVLSYSIKNHYDDLAIKAIESGLDVKQWLNENVAKKEDNPPQEYAIEYRKSDNLYTYLHLAASYNSPKVIEALIKKSLDINTKSKGQLKYPALGFAAYKKNLEGFKYLVSIGAKLYERYDGANIGSSYTYYTLGAGRYYTPLSLSMVIQRYKDLKPQLMDFILEQKDFKKYLELEDEMFYKSFYHMAKLSTKTTPYAKVIQKFDSLGFKKSAELEKYIDKIDAKYGKGFPSKKPEKEEEQKTVMDYIVEDKYTKAKDLLENGADFNQSIYKNNNILHRIFTIRKYARHNDFIKYVVNNSDILNKPNDDGETPMDDFLENSYYKDTKLLEFLIDNGAKLGTKKPIYFFKNPHAIKYKKLLFVYLEKKLQSEDLTQFCISLMKKNKTANIIDIMKYAIKNKQKIDINKIYVKAHRLSEKKIEEFCLLFGANLDDLSVLIYGDIDALSYKRIMYHIQNKVHKEEYGVYLEYLVSSKNLEENFDMKLSIIKELTKNLPAQSKYLQKSFEYSLSFAYKKHYEKLIEYFIYKDVKLDVKTKYKRYKSITPIVWAIKFNKLKSLKYILSKGVSADFKPDRMDTPIMHAFHYDRFDMFKLLLKHGVKLHGDFKKGTNHKQTLETLLMQRIAKTQGLAKKRDLLYEIIDKTIYNNKDTKYIQALIDTEKFDLNDLQKKYLLHAIEFNNRYLDKTLEVIKLLVKNGVKLDNIYARQDSKDKKDLTHTALVYSAYSRANYIDYSYHSKKLKLLLELGSNVNETDQDKDSVLHNMVMTFIEVTKRKDMSIFDRLDAKKGIEILLKYKADTTLKNKSGQRTYDLAHKYLNDTTVLEMLKY